MHRRLRGHSVATLFFIPTMLCAAVGCGAPADSTSAPEGTTASDGATLCSSRVVGTRRNGTSIEDREIYSFANIDARLRRYPELVEATGLTRVASCDDARQFTQKYRAYKDAHPDFNDVALSEEYLAWLKEPAATLPPELEEGPEVQKIWGGAPGIKLGVVELELASGVTCSAAFISDSWMLTAASCVPMPTPPAKSRFERVTIWQLDGDGQPSRAGGGTVPTVFYPYEGWIGTGDPEHNLALVHIYPEFGQGYLYEAEDAALPIATQQAGATTKLEPWGWGQFEDSNELPDVLLGPPFGTNGKRLGVAFGATEVKNEYIVATAKAGDARICTGDEGGPLLEDVTVGTDPKPTEIIHAVAADFVGTHCADVGGSQFWARVDTQAKLSWIQDTMRFKEDYRNSAFDCEPVHRGTTDVNQSYTECWPRYCQTIDDCIYGDRCVHLFGLDHEQRCVQWL